MKHYHAKPSAHLQAIQPSAVSWCCANLALAVARLDIYMNAHVQLHAIT